jgi:hypothetical protein
MQADFHSGLWVNKPSIENRKSNTTGSSVQAHAEAAL